MWVEGEVGEGIEGIPGGGGKLGDGGVKSRWA